LWVDLNRCVEDETLIRSVVDGEILSWNRGLTVAGRERRIVDCHHSYHREIDRQIERRAARGVRPLIFAVHSYTPVMRGRERPYEIGVLYEHHPRPAHRLGRLLREHGLRVRYNEPYSGRRGMMYSAERHGAHHGLPALELELNQALFEIPSAARRLGAAVAGALRRIVSEELSD
jgi:predicted N-formylglutamate amidohydrolase